MASIAAAALARVTAKRDDIRQVVSYVAQRNVSFDAALNVLKLYNNDSAKLPSQVPQQPQRHYSGQNAQPLVSASQSGDGPVAMAAASSDYSAALNWTTADPPSMFGDMDFTLLWLSVFLAIPVMLLMLCLCLYLNRDEDLPNKSLIDRDSEACEEDGEKSLVRADDSVVARR